jgi:hypothetical protein
MDDPAFPATTKRSLFGGPFDGETVSIYGRPYELWMPIDLPISFGEIDPLYELTPKWVAVYTRLTDKNQYQYLETRRE